MSLFTMKNIFLWFERLLDTLDSQWIKRSDAKITTKHTLGILISIVCEGKSSYASAIQNTFDGSILTTSAVSKIRARLPNEILHAVYDSCLTELFGLKTQAKSDEDHWSHIPPKLQNTDSFSFIRNTNLPKIRTIQSAQDLNLVAVDGTQIHKKQIPRGLRQYDTTNKRGFYDTYLLSTAYDVDRKIPLDFKIHPTDKNERTLLMQHVEGVCSLVSNPCFIVDRGYMSYELAYLMCTANIPFVARLPMTSDVAKHFKSMRSDDTYLHYTKTKRTSKTMGVMPLDEYKALPTNVPLRFVKWSFKGSVFYIATNLMSKNLYTLDFFKEVYHKRWGVETYYYTLKHALNLENLHALSYKGAYQEVAAGMISTLLSKAVENQINELGSTNETLNTKNTLSLVSRHILQRLRKLPTRREKQHKRKRHKRTIDKIADASKCACWRNHYEQNRSFPHIRKRPNSKFTCLNQPRKKEIDEFHLRKGFIHT